MKRAITRVVIVLTAVLVLSTCTTVPPREDLSAPEAKLSPLMEASLKGDTGTVKVLLATGADVNAKDNEGGTALMHAARKGHTETVQVLLAKGADVNAKNNNGNTALTLAALNGHPDTVKVLLAHGADVNAKDNRGYTALTWAAHYGHTDTVKILLAAGAGVSQTALMVAKKMGYKEIVRMLKEAGARE